MKNTSFLLDKEMVPPCLYLLRFTEKSPSVAMGSRVRPASEGFLLGVHGAKFSRRNRTRQASQAEQEGCPRKPFP